MSCGLPQTKQSRLLLAAVAWPLLLGADPVAAERPAICDKALATPELNLCSEQAWQAADAKLNAAFQGALEAIRKSDQPKPYDRVAWEQALRASQRAWVAFRDAECKGLVPMSWSGGTGTTSAVLECMAAKSKARTDELLAAFSQ